MSRLSSTLVVFFLSLLLVPAIVRAQTATTGTVLGTLKDATAAVVPKATIELTDNATGATLTATTNEAGQYVFTTVLPGTYTLKVSATGFKQAIVNQVKAEVAKSTTVDVTLEPGELTSTVDITATQELQTTDSTLGEVVNTQMLQDLPTVTRRVVELAFLQVATTPNTGNANLSRSVAGGRGDQNTFILDGLDISDSQVGGTCCGNIGSGVPLPVDAIAEFRAGVTNQNASFGRAAGGQYALTTRRGTEDYHGSLYWYHRNDNLNANTWIRNRLNQRNPELKDNRGGVSLGGPLFGPLVPKLEDKLFFFTNLERRRFPQKVDRTRIVPSDTMRQGNLRFPDLAGNIVSYNLRTSTGCGPSGGQACDPRGVGISSVITQQFALLPPGNDSSFGDGFNTVGVTGPVDATESSDNVLARVDYNITANWRASGLWVWAQQRSRGFGFIDIRKGPQEFESLFRIPNDPRHYNFGLTGTISPRLVNEARFGYNRSTITFENPDPSTLVPGAGMALDLAGLDEPFDIAGSRAQIGRSTTWQLVDNVTWTKGKHTINPGVNIQWLRFFHSRKGAGALNVQPMAVIGGTASTVIPAAWRPPTCGGAVSTNCLRPADVGRWNTFYGAALGIVDTAGKFTVRDPNTGKVDTDPQVLREGEINEGTWQHYEYYVSDTWRLTNSLTFNLGFNGIIEPAFKEDKNRRSYLIDLQTGRPIFVNDYLNQRAEAARQGKAYNPGLAFAPTSQFPDIPEMPTQKTISPRVAVAWNPSASSGWLARLTGGNRTVVRGGYATNYNRIQAVGIVQFPMIGNAALAQPNVINGPACNFGGTPGPGCVAGQPFRVGVDGPAPLPPIAQTIPIPYAPPSPFGLGLGNTLAYDPDFRVGYVHSADLTIQRELPGNFVLEVGWIGRYGRNLMVEQNINAVPFFIADMSGRSQQVFSQAFDLVSAQLRAGLQPTAVTPQPWFENSLGPGSTVALATSLRSAFINQQVYALWFNGIDPMLISQGKTPVNNRQIYATVHHTHGGFANYNAGFITINKRFGHGLSFNFNYTFSKNLETLGGIHDGSSGQQINPFDLNYAYGPALSDRTHGINVYGLYELPFGKGKFFNTGGVLDKLIGGWQVSAVGQWFSGRPQFVGVGAQPFGGHPFFSQESAPILRNPNANEGRYTGVFGQTIARNGDPARGGTGLNLFKNPEAVFNSFRPFSISLDQRTSRGVIRGLPWATLDMSLSKRTRITERINIRFSADFLNALNHPLFEDPFLSLLDPASFGVLSAQPISTNNFYNARQIQLGLRIEF
ncbi:MAG: carboxypeptidase-like regulatory domain-containing protein [Acidobacteria bacterium]|nr:carboxypeptidase-like regulatory domain-containing protein [Acidobacteriota bacterium]